MSGGETVLRTFSSEWLNYDWDGQAYWNYTSEVIYKGMDFMLDLVHRGWIRGSKGYDSLSENGIGTLGCASEESIQAVSRSTNRHLREFEGQVAGS
jgi:hypothetical protein